jgi:hypothetical protein
VEVFAHVPPGSRYAHMAALQMITFVLLNPSTADAVQLDPTLRRCVGFAKREGYGGMVILNLRSAPRTRK